MQGHAGTCRQYYQCSRILMKNALPYEDASMCFYNFEPVVERFLSFFNSLLYLF